MTGQIACCRERDSTRSEVDRKSEPQKKHISRRFSQMNADKTKGWKNFSRLFRFLICDYLLESAAKTLVAQSLLRSRLDLAAQE